jgi:hypothetical protein
VLSFSSDDQALGVTGDREVNRVLRVAGGQEMRTLSRSTPRGPERIAGTALHPAGRLLAVVTKSGFGLWDLFTGEELAFVTGNVTQLGRAISFDRSGALWTCGSSGLLRWTVQTSGLSRGRLRVGPPERFADVALNGNDPSAHSADGRTALVPLYNEGALLIHRGPPRRTLRLGPQYDVRRVYLSPDGRWAVTGSHWMDESQIRYKVWDADSGRLVAELPYPDVNYVGGFSPDSRWLLYSDGKQSKRLEVASLAAAPLRPASAAPAPRDPGRKAGGVRRSCSAVRSARTAKSGQWAAAMG